jgi:hypothetical protein
MAATAPTRPTIAVLNSLPRFALVLTAPPFCASYVTIRAGMTALGNYLLADAAR